MADKKKEADLPAIMILRKDLRGPFYAKLAEGVYASQGIRYDPEQFPSAPERQYPLREMDLATMITARYRSAIIEKLLDTGSVQLKGFEEELIGRQIMAQFFPEAYRQAYREVFEYLSGLKNETKA